MKKIFLYLYLIFLAMIFHTWLAFICILWAATEPLAVEFSQLDFTGVMFLLLYLWAISSNIISIIFTIRLIEGIGSRIKNIIFANVFWPTAIIMYILSIHWIVQELEYAQ